MTKGPDAPIMPKDVPLPVRPDFGTGKDKRVERVPIAPLAIRQKIWEIAMGDLSFTARCVGPFEIVLPPWLDFHGLIWGENGELYEQLISSLHEFLTVGWLVASGRTTALVVGFKSSSKVAADVPRHWQDLTLLWHDVQHWVVYVNNGSWTTLVDSLAVTHWTRMTSVREEPWKELGSLHLESEANP
jgi:hypothetical protein